MLIAKALALLLLPPGGIILLMVVGVFAWRRWWGRWMVAGGIVALLLLSLTPVKNLLIRPLEFSYPPLDTTHMRADDAIVVLGGGINSQAPEYRGEDFLSEAALMRAAYARGLAMTSGATIWVSGGTPLRHDQLPEGEVMRRWLIATGVPPGRVYAENHADNTWQNAAFLKPLLSKAGVRRVVLVTTAWHMPRAVWSFEQAGIVVVAAPCDYSSSQRPYILLDWLPDAGTFANSVRALHEYLGLLYYRLRYGVN